jgi:hypothetical protein
VTIRPDPAVPAEDAAFDEALGRLLAPLAALCLARGVRFAAVEERLRQAFVDAARGGDAPAGKRDVSRVSAATGLTRREVTRISNELPAAAAVRRSPATQIFTRWLGHKRYHDARGRPRALPRQGKAPSFESLAQSVTQDVHPRTLLDELCRLGLAEVNAKTDTVRLVRDAFVPRDDRTRMLEFLGANVGDHLAAAVANVRAETPLHLEQAVFADDLSAESTETVRALVTARWKELLTALVPRIQALIDADAKAGRVADRRVRVGLYSYHAAVTPTPPKETT